MLPLDRFHEYLQAHGNRLTREKQLIAEQVFQFRRAFDTEELIEHLSRRPFGARVSRSTVYRTITDLANANVISQFIPNDPTLWIVNSTGE